MTTTNTTIFIFNINERLLLLLLLLFLLRLLLLLFFLLIRNYYCLYNGYVFFKIITTIITITLITATTSTATTATTTTDMTTTTTTSTYYSIYVCGWWACEWPFSVVSDRFQTCFRPIGQLLPIYRHRVAPAFYDYNEYYHFYF